MSAGGIPRSEMIDAEYRRMAAAESEMWWYRSLHEFLVEQIQKHHGGNRRLRVLDAGCGTGGFLRFLRERGYDDIAGVDISPLAVEFCRGRGLAVEQDSISNPAPYARLGPFDVIVSMDVICSLPTEEERERFLRAARGALKEGGMLLVQTPAFPLLGGIHDIAVSVNHRYRKADMRALLERAGLQDACLSYRLVLLTPLVFVARLLQRWRLRMFPGAAIESDVAMPGAFINRLLLGLQRLEDKRLPWKPFGTSLQIVFIEARGRAATAGDQ